MKEKINFIIKDIACCLGGGESSKVYSITSIESGETEIVIEKTIKKIKKVITMNKSKSKVKRRKGWIWLLPNVVWNKPTEQEIRLANTYGTIIRPCTITYTLPTKKK